jgi:XrtJ-associated TM-motif-TM protein
MLVGFAVLNALLLASPAWALQGLCSNSPENPSLILGLIGAAAAGYPALSARVRHFIRRKTHQQDRQS